MSQERIINFIDEPRNDVYKALLWEAVKSCDILTLIVRPNLGILEAGHALLAGLERNFRVKCEVREWPGTRLLSGSAVLLEYNFNDAVCRLLQDAVVGLYDWTQPALPEDPVLWRSDRTPWLVTIAHERDGYLALSETERLALFNRVPELISII